MYIFILAEGALSPPLPPQAKRQGGQLPPLPPLFRRPCTLFFLRFLTQGHFTLQEKSLKIGSFCFYVVVLKHIEIELYWTV